MQTVTVLTVEALKRAVQDGVQRIVIGCPRLGADILRTVGARPAMAAAPAFIPAVVFPALAPLMIFMAVCALGVILYLAFMEGYEIVIESREDGGPCIVIRKRAPHAAKHEGKPSSTATGSAS